MHIIFLIPHTFRLDSYNYACVQTRDKGYNHRVNARDENTSMCDEHNNYTG